VDLRRRISIGLPAALEFEEFRSVITEFEDYLYGLYFSPPLPIAAMHTRLVLTSLYAREGAERDALRCIDFARSRGLRLELAINATDDERTALAALDYAIDRGIEPEEIVALESFGELARERFPDARLVYSYNNCVRDADAIEAIPDSFDDVVLGGACIRQRAFLDRLRERGFGTRLLLNNGCSFNCGWCRESARCAPTFEFNLASEGVTRLYALQSILPEELAERYEESPPDLVKLSTRPSDLSTFRGMIASYVEGRASPWIDRDPEAWRLWCRLSHFMPHFSDLELDAIAVIKDAIWEGLTFEGTVS